MRAAGGTLGRGHGEGLRHQVTLVGWAGGFREVIKAITDILLDSEV
ncbi:MAG TPA: hypothetical protein PLN56_03350 [Methanoregulaceae archaeon]|nr:MAG: hypothetical protein IPI71_08980 [Methanolinea sp.]HON81452.1 hypothetical protein [Methanoregulaceae archaeon]HPD10020.1 hypothetical protein [Methanoregulaceae archaeon]HRT15026.1 hypothetical protein [Methanoregulaceae archaeon]HRU30597.1 hypothetical protein [Methanoregulaceae archaeon]